MEYKEEYQKALERAKKGLPIDEVFPELKESEDERIRKALIHLINEQDGFLTAIDGISVKDIIAYLEKQKEQKITECTSDSVLQKIKRAITSCRELSEHYKDTKENFYQYYGGKADGLQLALAYFGNKNELAEQKPAEWSEEEKKVLDSIIDDYEKAAKSFCGYDGKIMLLKAIRDGEYNLPKQEWSDEDKKILYEIIRNVSAYDAYTGTTYQQPERHDKKINFLRTLHPSWKPSEEQMEALKDAFRKDGGNEYRKVINSLYCDLQKLL